MHVLARRGRIVSTRRQGRSEYGLRHWWITAIIAIRLVGVLGALTVACWFAGIGLFTTSLFVKFKCLACGGSVTPDEQEKRSLISKRLMYFIGAGLLLAAAITLGLVWWYVVKTVATTEIPSGY